MSTPVNSLRSGTLQNASFQRFTAGVPTGYKFAETVGGQAVVVQLTRQMEYLHNAGIEQFEVKLLRALSTRAQDDPITRTETALRLRAAASWAIGEVQFGIGDIVGAGVDTQGLPWIAGQRQNFQFWLRGTPGKLVNLEIRAFTAADTDVGFLHTPPLRWEAVGGGFTNSAGLEGVLFELSPVWKQYNVAFTVPLFVGANMTGQASTDSLLFRFRNASTMAVNDFIDIADLEYQIQPGQGGSFHQEA